MSEATTSGLKVDLSGQVAIVTGASQGLGQAMAIELAANGAKVVCVARNAEKLAQTVATITAAGGIGRSLSCDVKDGAKVDQLVDAVVDEMGTARYPGQQRRHHPRHAVAADEGRRVGRRDRNQPARHVPVCPRGLPRHDAGPLRTDHQHQQCVRA